MGEAVFNVPIQKVCRYLQVITSEMRHQIFVGMLTDKVILPIRVPLLHLVYRCSQRKLKNQELSYLQKQRKKGTVSVLHSTANGFHLLMINPYISPR